MSKTRRNTVDLSAYPDLVVIYLGMRVNGFRGLRTLISFGSRISEAVSQKPEGLLLHEPLLYSILPPHAGMRQYWRDFESLESWARSLPHKEWWRSFLKDSGGTGFWHEAYFRRGGMEAVYDDMTTRIGLSAFAPVVEARGTMFSARSRAKIEGEARDIPPITENDFYS